MSVAHIDGSSRGNPGPSSCAAVFHGPLGRLNSPVFIERFPWLTCNEAEYHGLILALRKALEVGEKQLHVYTDSEVMARQIHGRYKIHAENLRQLHAEAMELIQRFELVVVQHIPREKNHAADRAAYHSNKERR
jgi:ribonuclease HI